MTKQEVLNQLKKEGVTDLDSFADMLVQKTHPNGDGKVDPVQAAIIYHHGFVSH